MWPIAATLMHKYKQLSLYNFSYSPLRQNARLDIMNFICWNLHSSPSDMPILIFNKTELLLLLEQILVSNQWLFYSESLLFKHDLDSHVTSTQI